MPIQSEEGEHSDSNSSSEHRSGTVVGVGGHHVASSTLFKVFSPFLLKKTSGEVESDKVGREKRWRRKNNLWIAFFWGLLKYGGYFPHIV